MISSTKIKLPFGLNKNNELVHIADVEGGEKCNCICIECASSLIAVKGKIKQHHFRHKVDIECEGGLESAIHLAAKQIIKEKMQITLPGYVVTESAMDSRGVNHIESESVVENGTIITFDSVEEEKGLQGIRADILAKKDKASLIIEVYYRHIVDGTKIEKIKKEGKSAIEVNLSDLMPENVKDWGAFWSCINDPMRIRWLHNIKHNDSIHQNLKSKLQAKVHKLEIKYEQEKISNLNKEQKERDKLVHALKELEIFRSEEYIAELKQKILLHPSWKRSCEFLGVTLDKLPNFLNVDVPDGDWIFDCDKRIWQIAFYNAFILSNNDKPFCIKRVNEWLNNSAICKTHPAVKLVGIFGRRYPELVPSEISRNLPSAWKTLKAYFYYLWDLGMLELSGEDYRRPGNIWFKVKSKMPVIKTL